MPSKPFVIVHPGHSGEQTELELILSDGTVLARRWVPGEVTDDQTIRNLAAAADELRSLAADWEDGSIPPRLP